MKQLLSLIVLSCLVFGLTAPAAAGTTVYLDAWGGGNFDFDTKSEDLRYENGSLIRSDSEKAKADDDLSGFTLGLESTLDRFKVGMEYGLADTEFYPASDGVTSDTKRKCELVLAEVKGGYRLVANDKLDLDLFAAILDINGELTLDDDPNKFILNLGGNLVGFDVNFKFNEKSSLQGTIASSLLGATVSVGNNYEEDPTITEYKLKFNYFITNNLALTLGYRLYQYSASTTEIDEYEHGGIINKEVEKAEFDGSISGYTFGVAYQF